MRLETVSVAEAATNRLRERLFAGEYQAGEEIKDTHVASVFGIARPTARVAVQQLINEGMLVRPPGMSARVRVFHPDQVLDIYRVRNLIEIDAIKEIRARNLSTDRINEALEGFRDLPTSKDDWSRIAAADAAFHSAVVNSASSSRLQAYFSGITSEVRLLIAHLKTQYTAGEMLYEEHSELYRLLCDQTTTCKQLEDAWIEHLDSARDFLEQHLA